MVESVRRIAEDRVGWPVIPVAYFRFTRPLTPRSPTDLIEPALTAPLLLLDIDPRSPDRGTLVPCVASTVPADRYAVEHLLAVAPYPGWILHSRRTYAVVVTDAVLSMSPSPPPLSSMSVWVTV